MKTGYKHLLNVCFILLTAVFSTIYCSSQEIPSMQVLNAGEGTNRLHENLALLTDRDTYVAGENIGFRIFNLTPAALKDPLWSRIVYVELLGLDNKPLIQQKLKLTEEGAYGMMTLTGSPPSGYYYIRVYTRWMRNFPASDYPSKLVRILNPNNDEPVIVQNGNGNGKYQVAGSYPAGMAELPSRKVSVQAGQEVYGKRQKVSLEIRIPDGFVDDGLCLTVVRKEAIDSSLNFMCRETEATEVSEQGDWVYIPETRGMSISGTVVMQAGGKPLPHSRVHLSLIGDEPDYFAYQTGEDGRFYIALPDYLGTKDFYTNAETSPNQRIEILIDQDFSEHYVIPKPVSFQVREEEKQVLEEMLLIAQVNEIFRIKDQEADSSARSPDKALNFYGEPQFTLWIDDYVKLPSLEEFIFELVPEVLIKKSGGKKLLLVTSGNSGQSIYAPLVLLDHVAITDLDPILDISPERIESIELITGNYIHGNITFGGILSITSRNNDLAGIDLPDDSYFFNFTTLSAWSTLKFPDYSLESGNLRNPDFRNCLYWNPVLEKDDKGIFRSVFYTSDRSGEYIALVRGFNASGHKVYGSTVLRVE